MLEVNVPGSIESVVDPPVIPIMKCPPFWGVAALTVLLINAGDATAMRPRADTRAINSRRVILPSVSKFPNSSSFDIAHILLLNVIRVAKINSQPGAQYGKMVAYSPINTGSKRMDKIRYSIPRPVTPALAGRCLRAKSGLGEDAG
jgi:hypothetical protein